MQWFSAGPFPKWTATQPKWLKYKLLESVERRKPLFSCAPILLQMKVYSNKPFGSSIHLFFHLFSVTEAINVISETLTTLTLVSKVSLTQVQSNSQPLSLVLHDSLDLYEVQRWWYFQNPGSKSTGLLCLYLWHSWAWFSAIQ